MLPLDLVHAALLPLGSEPESIIPLTKAGSDTPEPFQSQGTSTDAAVLLALRACDTFQREHQRYPGAGEMPDLDHDKAACSAAVSASLSDIGAAAPSVMEDIGEVVRIVATFSLFHRRNSLVSLSHRCNSQHDVSPGLPLAVAEMVRFGATEPHAVAAFVAGIASQEATKLLTEQFVVLSGTLVYNGMACTTTCIPL